ncbi:MAG: hypothetical protein KGZ68_09015 [Dechloromonas sp.]|nr:hypothetical protein [Dechloromonas sp.]
MKTPLVLCLSLLLPLGSLANPVPDESCEQIRARITSQLGTLPKPDTELLKTVGARKDCRFTSAEVYRAGFGEQPKAPYEAPRYRARHGHGEDD